MFKKEWPVYKPRRNTTDTLEDVRPSETLANSLYDSSSSCDNKIPQAVELPVECFGNMSMPEMRTNDTLPSIRSETSHCCTEEVADSVKPRPLTTVTSKMAVHRERTLLAKVLENKKHWTKKEEWSFVKQAFPEIFLSFEKYYGGNTTSGTSSRTQSH